MVLKIRDVDQKAFAVFFGQKEPSDRKSPVFKFQIWSLTAKVGSQRSSPVSEVTQMLVRNFVITLLSNYSDHYRITTTTLISAYFALYSGDEPEALGLN